MHTWMEEDEREKKQNRVASEEDAAGRLAGWRLPSLFCYQPPDFRTIANQQRYYSAWRFFLKQFFLRSNNQSN